MESGQDGATREANEHIEYIIKSENAPPARKRHWVPVVPLPLAVIALARRHRSQTCMKLTMLRSADSSTSTTVLARARFGDVLMTRRIFCRGKSENGQNEVP
ncbi:hypothetical protein B0H14DRAFT_2564202 [Mycena olivaceomarginata]|nr:hypothetical protein B0H14DRAFT_2564202 [Mycena olivaceomarginata]